MSIGQAYVILLKLLKNKEVLASNGGEGIGKRYSFYIHYEDDMFLLNMTLHHTYVRVRKSIMYYS